MIQRSFMWLMIFGIGLLAFAPTATSAETAWIDELSNSVSFYKATYPSSDWSPYQDKLTLVREAVDRGDQRTVRMEMETPMGILTQEEIRGVAVRLATPSCLPKLARF